MNPPLLSRPFIKLSMIGMLIMSNCTPVQLQDESDCATESPAGALSQTEQDLNYDGAPRDLFAISKNDLFGALAAQGQFFGIQADQVIVNADQTYTIRTTPFTQLEDGSKLCDSTAFYTQPHAAGGATGVLVGPDLVLTASHTFGAATDINVAQSFCDKKIFFANYALTSPATPLASLPTRPAADVYFCKQVLYFNPDSNSDIAVVQLDRAVAGRVPLKPRRSGPALMSMMDAVMVGYPHHLPAKIDNGVIQIGGSELHAYFTGNLRVAVGSSGAALVNKQTGRIEGIVQSGYTDTIQDKPQMCDIECLNASVCSSGFVSGPAATEFAAAIPPQGLEVAVNSNIPSTGPAGGPFANPSFTYTLSAGNKGLGVDYLINVKGPLRVVASGRPQHLQAGASELVTVAIDETATRGLNSGVYVATISFTDTTYGTIDYFYHQYTISGPVCPSE